jgi:hypothetical protein
VGLAAYTLSLHSRAKFGPLHKWVAAAPGESNGCADPKVSTGRSSSCNHPNAAIHGLCQPPKTYTVSG